MLVPCIKYLFLLSSKFLPVAPSVHLDRRKKVDVWRMDAGFYGKSTPHHSNTPQYHAQGHWPRPHNLLQQLLSLLPFFYECLTSKFLWILSHISSFTLGEKTRPDTHKPKHTIDNTPAPNIVHIGTTPWPGSRQPFPSSQIPTLFKIHCLNKELHLLPPLLPLNAESEIFHQSGILFKIFIDCINQRRCFVGPPRDVCNHRRRHRHTHV